MAAQRLVRALVRRGLIAAAGEALRPAQTDEPGLIAYRVTLAGLAAIGVVQDGAAEEASGAGLRTPEQDDAGPSGAPQPAAGQGAPVQTRAPREGSKSALVLALLSGEGGASLGDIVAATGWLPHTARAALTGLRQRGYPVERTPGPDGASRDQIATTGTGEAV